MVKTLLDQPKHVLEQIIANAIDAFVVIDAGSKVLAWTDRAAEMFGWSAEEAVGQDIANLIIPPAAREAHHRGMRSFLETGRKVVLGKRVELYAQDRHARLFPVELSVALIERDGGAIFSAAIRDLSERHAIEEQFRVTFEQAAVGIAHIAPNGKILRVNHKLCGLLGYTREELLEVAPQSLTHPDDKDVASPHLQKLLAGAVASTSYEKRYLRKSGEPIWIKVTASLLREPSGAPKYFIVVIDDISEDRRVQEQAERLATVIEATPDFVGFANLAGEVLYVNAAGRKMTGIPPGVTLRGISIADKYPRWAHKVVKQGIEVALREGSWHGESAVLSAGGEEIPVSQVIIVHNDRDGSPQYMSTIIRDMTERDQKERALKEADRRKDEFLAMLAHELRNPLAPISTAAQILKLGGLDESRVRQASEIIARQAEHMSELIDDLLDVSRVTRGLVTLEQDVLDVGSVVADAIEQVRALIEVRHHHLVVESPPQPIRVQGDRTRLVQIIANVLNNAAKYTPEGGNISVGIEVDGAHVSIKVRDNGIGIPGDVLPHVFELFVQGKRSPDRSQGGLGLGLALVKTLVELHGGKVAAYSAGPGKGSEFSVRLPRMEDPGQARGGESRQHSAAPGNALRVLLVDDNVDAAEMLAMLLEAQGHQVAVEYSGRAALDRALRELPQVLLLDIGLPDMDGYELARQIRRRPELSGATLIALTGYGRPEDIALSKSSGFDHHLLKPVDFTKLDSVLAALAV